MSEAPTLFPVPEEPTPEMIQAVIQALGAKGESGKRMFENAVKYQGTPLEPGLVFEIRAVLAVLRGVPLSKIKRGFRPRRSARKAP